jgi:hypothetical protein
MMSFSKWAPLKLIMIPLLFSAWMVEGDHTRKSLRAKICDTSLTALAAHGCALGSGRAAYGQVPHRTPLLEMSWMVCQYSSAGPVSSQKHQVTRVLK